MRTHWTVTAVVIAGASEALQGWAAQQPSAPPGTWDGTTEVSPARMASACSRHSSNRNRSTSPAYSSALWKTTRSLAPPAFSSFTADASDAAPLSCRNSAAVPDGDPAVSAASPSLYPSGLIVNVVPLPPRPAPWRVRGRTSCVATLRAIMSTLSAPRLGLPTTSNDD